VQRDTQVPSAFQQVLNIIDKHLPASVVSVHSPGQR
jgi:hypothetical protein